MVQGAIGIPQFVGGPMGAPPGRPYEDTTKGLGSGAVPGQSMK